MAYANVFPKGKLFAIQTSDLVLKEHVFASDVCAALAPRYHRRRKSRTNNSDSLGDALDVRNEEEYEEEDYEFDNRYSHAGEEEHVRSIRPRVATTSIVASEEQQYCDAVVSMQTTSEYREETSCVSARGERRAGLSHFLPTLEKKQ